MRVAALPLCLLLALASAGVAAPLRATDLEVSATATVASDYYFRGVSQTRNDPALQARLELEHPSGWFGGLFASTVDLPQGAYDTARHHDVEVDAHLGYGHEIGHGLIAVANGIRYAYVGRGHRYDYSELGVGLEYQGIAASVSQSDDALGFGGAGRVWELVARRPLPFRLNVSSGVGWYELERLHDHYAFWHLALRRSFGRVAANLGYFGSDANGRRLFGDRARGRLVLGISYGLR